MPKVAVPAVGRERFGRDLLAMLGLPVTAENIRFMVAWQQAEGTRAQYNPLATMKTWAGATQFNKVGVKNYASYEDGLQATAATLRLKHYTGIVAALRAGNSAEVVARAVANSPWGTGTNVLRVLGSTTSSGAGFGAVVGAAKQAAAAVQGQTTTAPAILAATDPVGYIRTNYPNWAWALDDPILGSIFREAPKHDPAWLESAVKSTDWWKHNGEKARAWYALRRTDPGEAETTLQNLADQLADDAGKLGFTLERERARQLADQALSAGMSPQEVENLLVSEFDYQPGVTRGELGLLADRLKQYASTYIVPLSDQAIDQWVTQILRKEQDEASFQGYIREQAKSLFPHLSAAIDAGTTVSQYVEPYRQIASRVLEVNPADVDFTQAKWSQAINLVDPESGQRQAMSLSEWEHYLKTLPEFRETQGANFAVDQLDDLIGRTFGRVA